MSDCATIKDLRQNRRLQSVDGSSFPISPRERVPRTITRHEPLNRDVHRGHEAITPSAAENSAQSFRGHKGHGTQLSKPSKTLRYIFRFVESLHDLEIAQRGHEPRESKENVSTEFWRTQRFGLTPFSLSSQTLCFIPKFVEKVGVRGNEGKDLPRSVTASETVETHKSSGAAGNSASRLMEF